MTKTRNPKILFLCTANSCRSQMAEGIARHLFGERCEVFSAGTLASYVNPTAIEVMKELDIDISGHRSESVTEYEDQEFDLVVTVCDNAKETCPVFVGSPKTLHLPFEDPVSFYGAGEEERLNKFRKVRDQIFESLNSELGHHFA